MRNSEEIEPALAGDGDEGAGTGGEAGGIVLILAMLAAVGWYWFDASSRSTRVENMILIVPMSIAAVLIGGGLICAALLRMARAPGRTDASSAAAQAGPGWRLAAIAGLLLGYAFSLEAIGLDVATALFLSGTFAALGVRGWVGLLVAPAVTALGVVAAMKVAFYIHVPTLFLGWL